MSETVLRWMGAGVVGVLGLGFLWLWWELRPWD